MAAGSLAACGKDPKAIATQASFGGYTPKARKTPDDPEDGADAPVPKTIDGKPIWTANMTPRPMSSPWSARTARRAIIFKPDNCPDYWAMEEAKSLQFSSDKPKSRNASSKSGQDQDEG